MSVQQWLNFSSGLPKYVIRGLAGTTANLTAKLSPWEAICMFTVIPQSPNRCLWCHGLLCFWCQRSPSEDWTRQKHLLCYELWFQNATVLLHMMLWSHDRKRPHVFIRMLHASCFSSLLPRWCSGRWIVSLFFCLMLWFLTFIHTFRDVNRRRVTIIGFVWCRSEQCIMNKIPAISSLFLV